MIEAKQAQVLKHNRPRIESGSGVFVALEHLHGPLTPQVGLTELELGLSRGDIRWD